MAPKIVCIAGPTACGKTTLGVLLAQRFCGEVVSVDSMQIYRGMTVGTAAPTAEEMQGVPHHMIAVRIRRSSGAPRNMCPEPPRWWTIFWRGASCPFW